MNIKVYPRIDLVATGKKIKKLREEKHISVVELQESLGFTSPVAIYKWQRGLCLPSSDNLYMLACLLEVAIDDILVGNRDEYFESVGSKSAESAALATDKTVKLVEAETYKFPKAG